MCLIPLLSVSQEIKWAKSYNGNSTSTSESQTTINNCIFDSQGNAYICGIADKNGIIDGKSIFANFLSNYNGSFIAKVDSLGTLEWIKSIQPQNNENTANISMQLINDTTLIFQTPLYPPQIEGMQSWFLDTTVTYKINQDFPLFPTRNCGHEAFLTLNHKGELKNAHYLYMYRETGYASNINTPLTSLIATSPFHVDKDGNLYLFVGASSNDHYLNIVIDDTDTINFGIGNENLYVNKILKFSPDFKLIWAKDFTYNIIDSVNYPFNNLNFTNKKLSFDEDDNMYLTGSILTKSYNDLDNPVVDLGNNNKIAINKNADYTSFIIKYDTSGTAQWANQIYVKSPSYRPTYFRYSVIQGDTIFVQYNLRGLSKNTENWYYFDSLYTIPIDTLNMMGSGWEHSGFVAYNKNTGEYISHGLIKGFSGNHSSITINNGNVYGQVFHNDSWDVGGLDTIITSEVYRVVSLFKWNDKGEVLDIMANYKNGSNTSTVTKNTNNYSEVFFAGNFSDTLFMQDTILTASNPNSVYMFVLQDSSFLNHYTVIRDTICDSVDWKGNHITWKGDYYDTLQAADGYDSIIIYRVQVRHSFKEEISVEINEGETYDFHGQKLYSAGVFYDSLQTINGCDSVYILNLSVKSGLDDINGYVNIESVELAPNPAKDEVVITYTIKENTQATFVLYNSEGKELVTKQLTGKGMQTVSLNNCPSGTYYYKVYTNEKVIKTDKLVIIK